MMTFNPTKFASILSVCAENVARGGRPALARELVGAQVFVIPSEIRNAAKGFAFEDGKQNEARAGVDAISMPKGAVLPAKRCILFFEKPLGDSSFALFLAQEGKRTILWTVGIHELAPLSSFEAGAAPINLHKRPEEIECLDSFSAQVAIVAYVLALIGQPRFVLSKRLPRDQSKRADRKLRHWGFGRAVQAWTRVSWNIGADVVAKLRSDPTFHPVALHFRRAHWRKAKAHFKDAVWLDGISTPRGAGWYQRIEELWAGHPAYGIVTSYHAPKMPSGLLAEKWAAQ